MPHVCGGPPCMQDFMSEVALNRDTIQLDAGDGSTKLVPEARLTGWQSDIGATFRCAQAASVHTAQRLHCLKGGRRWLCGAVWGRSLPDGRTCNCVTVCGHACCGQHYKAQLGNSKLYMMHWARA